MLTRGVIKPTLDVACVKRLSVEKTNTVYHIGVIIDKVTRSELTANKSHIYIYIYIYILG